MSNLSVNSFGVLSVLYGAQPNESDLLQAPGGVVWNLAADGTTGAVTVTSGAAGQAKSFVLYDANQTPWAVTIDDNGILTVASFDQTIVLAPAINAPILINGMPAVGYQLFVYQSGTQTAAITYKNGLFVSVQPMPILLNGYGLPTDPIFITVGQYYRFVLLDPNNVPVYTWDSLSGGIPSNITAPTEWISPSVTATFATASTFTLVGDQRTSFKPGRRLQCVGSSTLDGTIYSANYDGTLTTITVLLDSGNLDNTLASVSLALMNPVASAVPNRRSVGNNLVLSGGLTLATNQGINLVPLAMIMLNHAVPSGWLQCNGQAVSRTTYASLLAATTVTQVGTTVNTSAVVTGLSDTSKLNTGMKVSGTGIQAATVINSIDSPTQVTLSLAENASGTNPLLFSNFGIGDGSTTFNVPNLTPPTNLFYCIYAQV